MPTTVTTNYYLLTEDGFRLLLQNQDYPQITCNSSATSIDGCKIIFSSTTTTTP